MYTKLLTQLYTHTSYMHTHTHICTSVTIQEICLFHSKMMFVTMNVLFEWKKHLMLGPSNTVPDRLSPVGCGDLGSGDETNIM